MCFFSGRGLWWFLLVGCGDLVFFRVVVLSRGVFSVIGRSCRELRAFVFFFLFVVFGLGLVEGYSCSIVYEGRLR